MSAVPSPSKANHAQGRRDASAVSPEMVSITKAQHIDLVMLTKYWRSQHARAVQREQWRHERFGRIVHQLKEQAGKREADLLAELALMRARIRDLRQRVFGRQSERSKGASEQRGQCVARVLRGQRCGAQGHGRLMQSHLPGRSEFVTLDSPQCPQCGLALEEFPGTQDSEVLEIEVKAYRRVIQRQRYKCVCQCGCLTGIVTAPAPVNLMARGKVGISVWSTVLLAVSMYCLLMTAKLWSLNPRTWLTAYLKACADHAGQAPSDVSAFLPWAMDARQLAAMRACPAGAAHYPVGPHGLHSFDTS